MSFLVKKFLCLYFKSKIFVNGIFLTCIFMYMSVIQLLLMCNLNNLTVLKTYLSIFHKNIK